MEEKIAFFDIDGTLVDMKRKQISEKTVEALARLSQKGILLCVATGRSPLMLPSFPGIHFDAFLTFNGSYCFHRDGVIYENPIPTADVQQMIVNAAHMKRPLLLATENRLAANGMAEDLTAYLAVANAKPELADDFAQLAQGKVYQMMMGCKKSEYETAMTQIKGARITAWCDWAVDIIPANGGKGNGIRKILEYYHLRKEDAIAFGDGDNDIEMLQAVGTGVAMENASPGLKAVADDFCPHVEQDGVFAYCKRHLF